MQPELTTLMLKEKLLNLRRAIFYIYDESGGKVTASIVNDLVVDQEGSVWFYANSMPLSVEYWNRYGSELHFYQKGVKYTVQLFGLATITDFNTLLIKFQADSVVYNSMELIEPKPSYMKVIQVLKDLLTFGLTTQHQYKLT